MSLADSMASDISQLDKRTYACLMELLDIYETFDPNDDDSPFLANKQHRLFLIRLWQQDYTDKQKQDAIWYFRQIKS